MYVLWFQQIVFEGTWGSSRANGFIGFDDITFFSAACSSKFILTYVLLIYVLYDDITWIVITANTSVFLKSIQSIRSAQQISGSTWCTCVIHLFSLPTSGTESGQLFIGDAWFSFPAIILRTSCILMFCIVFWLWKLESYKVWWHSFQGGSFTTCCT
jgi:hypothetical protein